MCSKIGGDLLFVAWLLFSVCGNGSMVRGDNFTIGYLTTLFDMGVNRAQGLRISGALTYAIDQINSNATLLAGHKLSLTWSDKCNNRSATIKALTEQWRDGAIAFFGPEDTCDVEAHIAAAWDLPMISYKCTDSTVSDKETFPTFVRTFPPDTQVTKSVIALLKHHGWKEFMIIQMDQDRWANVAQRLKTVAIKNDITPIDIWLYTKMNLCCQRNQTCCQQPFSFPKLIEETHKKTRIYVFLGETNDLIRFMQGMHNEGYLEGGQYVIIYVDLEEYREKDSYRYFLDSRENITDIMKSTDWYTEVPRSLLVIVPTPPSSADYCHFEDKVREYNQKPPFNFGPPVPGMPIKRYVGIYAAYLYDSVKLYAEALDEVLSKNGSARNGTLIISKIINRRFESIAGVSIQVDENGDAEGNYSVLSLLDKPMTVLGFELPKSFVPVGIFVSQGPNSLPELKFQPDRSIDWIGGKPPDSRPPCGFDGSLCKQPHDPNREIASSILGGLLVVVLASAIILYRNWKYEQEIAGLLWKLNLKEILLRSNHPLSSNSKTSLVSQTSMESRVCGQVFTTAGSYKGTIVAIKQLTYRKKIGDIPRAMKIEMKLMREIRHDNINPYIGSCLEPNSIYIITEYCSKGSLLDILDNDDIKLDPILIASLVWDLIKGMIYLHDSDLKVHGNLKSSNCVVNSRWVLQVADFGLHELRRNAQPLENKNEYSHHFGQLWTAPEILRDPDAFPKGSQKGDVYSFAVILFEIFGREGPYPHSQVCDLQPCDIINKVTFPKNNEMFRPDIGILVCQDYVIDCMKDCWEEKPEGRPDFRHIRHRLKPMRQGMKPDIFDHMMCIMEKYANNLEELVEERTGLLVEEKKKTEALLHRMLPPPVAAALMRGEFVVPESFDAVTIYFSDIVGFTEMSAQSTPMEVVTFLNELYTVFDNAISNYGVYKVETIGDAYMVVSGLPIRNADRHAGEIASMALELLAAVKTFKIPHRPEETLKLRIGIHTGPVVAGVVGKTMPRYCLFGDTVNTASRMESNGDALKIHISHHCKEALDKLGGYVINERGPMDIKGKGQMITHWLISQTENVVKKKESHELCPLFRGGRFMPVESPESNWKRYRSSCIPRVPNQSTRSIQEYGDKSQLGCRSRNYSPVRTFSYYKSCRKSDLQEKPHDDGVLDAISPLEKPLFSNMVVGEEEPLPDPQPASPQQPNHHPAPVLHNNNHNNNNNNINGHLLHQGSDSQTLECNLNKGSVVPILDISENGENTCSESTAMLVSSPMTNAKGSTSLDESAVSPENDELTQLLRRGDGLVRPTPVIKEVGKRWRSCSEINPLRVPPKSLKTWLTGLFNHKDGRDGFTPSQNGPVPSNFESIV